MDSRVEIYLPIAEMPVDMFLILGMGVAVGFISGMFGIGGGFLLTPLLIFVGIPAAVAVATQGPQIAASSMTGSLAYWRRKAIDFKLAYVLLAGGLVGTALGVVFFNQMRRVGQLDTVITLSYVVLMGTVGVLVTLESAKATFGRGKDQRKKIAGRHRWFEGLPLKMRFHRAGMYVSAIPLMGVALMIGFAGAVLGIGGGFILVPALIYIFRVPANVVVGTSLFQILFTMIAATMFHAATNQSVDLFLALLLMTGGVFGAQFGARAGANLRGEYFRLLLGMLILIVAARFATEVFSPPREPFSVTQTETVR